MLDIREEELVKKAATASGVIFYGIIKWGLIPGVK
jgi:hypothetical protein